jgi:hypothetical protein
MSQIVSVRNFKQKKFENLPYQMKAKPRNENISKSVGNSPVSSPICSKINAEFGLEKKEIKKEREESNKRGEYSKIHRRKTTSSIVSSLDKSYESSMPSCFSSNSSNYSHLPTSPIDSCPSSPKNSKNLNGFKFACINDPIPNTSQLWTASAAKNPYTPSPYNQFTQQYENIC